MIVIGSVIGLRIRSKVENICSCDWQGHDSLLPRASLSPHGLSEFDGVAAGATRSCICVFKHRGLLPDNVYELK